MKCLILQAYHNATWKKFIKSFFNGSKITRILYALLTRCLYGLHRSAFSQTDDASKAFRRMKNISACIKFNVAKRVDQIFRSLNEIMKSRH